MTTENKETATVTTEAKTQSPEVATKEDLKSLQQNFNSLIDTISQAFQAPAKTEPVKTEQVSTITKEEMEEHGFDEKQIKFIDKMFEAKIGNVKQESVLATTQQEYDTKAFSEFPELNDQNTNFYKLTQSIIAKKKQVDPYAKNRPDLIYSAALEAERETKKQLEKINKEKNTSEIVRQETIRRGYVEGTRSSMAVSDVKKDENITPERKQIRELMGLQSKCFDIF